MAAKGVAGLCRTRSLQNPYFNGLTSVNPYTPAVELRFAVLRAPLGMPRGSEIYTNESDTLHLVAHEGNVVLGCVLLHPLSDGKSGKYFKWL